MRDDDRHIPLTIRMDVLPPLKRAKGGLATHAKRAKEAGRYGDDMLVHLNKDEFEQLRQAWGEPTINPETGLPEYFLSGLQKWFSQNPVASAVLPAAASILFPGIGGAIGDGVNSALGGALGSYANVAGQGLLGAGLGALTGGGKGALIGAAGGVGGSLLSGALGGGGLGNLFGASGAGSSGSLADHGFHGAGTSSAGVDAGTTSSGGSGGLLGGLSLGKLANPQNLLLALTGAGAIASAFHKQPDQAVQQGQQNVANAQAQFNRPLPQVQFNRQRMAQTVDPYHYGEQGGQQFFAGNQTPTVLAKGGQPQPGLAAVAPSGDMGPQAPQKGALAHVAGPGSGRDDKIPSMLSDGEYVIDAEAVSMLGDGSNKEGAKRLDQFRENLRAHKGKRLAKGKISPNAKPPHQYLPKGAMQ